MVMDRVMVSLDEDVQSALDGLTGRTNKIQSELVRETLVFYVASFKATTTDIGLDLEAYHQILSSGKHVLLGVDFLHTFPGYMESDDGEPAPGLLNAIDRVTAFRAHEYHGRLESLAELLDWLPFCGFLAARASGGDTFHVTFPTEFVK